jgi:hypothetical protein
MLMESKLLALLAPLLIIFYEISEYFEWLDKITKRDKEVAGFVWTGRSDL